MKDSNTYAYTAKIYQFPVTARNAARFAEQVRRSRELAEARAAAGVMASTGWYHDEAVAAEAARKHHS